MKAYRPKIKLFFQIVLSLLLLYTINRALFLAFNNDYFNDASKTEYLISFVHGLRFDFSAIAILSMPFFLIWLIPCNWSTKTLTLTLFIPHLFGFLANTCDIEYYRFTFKRSTFDIFTMVSGKDFFHLLPQFLIDFWFIPIIWILISYGFWLFLKRIVADYKTHSIKKTSEIIRHIAFSLCLIFILLLGIRGGWQLRPISIISANNWGNPTLTPVTLNTPFSIIKSAGKKMLIEQNYYNENELSKHYTPGYEPDLSKSFNKKNVVIIILESFSSEHISSLNPDLKKSYTPFLDSLLPQCLYFSDAYANGKKSIEGIPAIAASIPSLLNSPFTNSPYNGNRIESIASILGKSGYQTSFYHGGNNGTMGFDAFAKAVGYQHYYGRDEFPDQSKYDGKWGILDEPYFQYYADQLTKTAEPFFSTIFSLSSHHPYFVPAPYDKLLPKGNHPVLQAIAYTDLSLRKFFDAAKSKSWFKNTIFVITADHTSEALNPKFKTRQGIYRIPIAYLIPGDTLKGKFSKTTQQIDIMPTILGLLHYNQKAFCFGKNILDPRNEGFAINFLNENYQYINNSYSLIFDNNKTIEFFNTIEDPHLTKNLANKNLKEQDAMEQKVKAFIQTYNHALISNKMKN